MPNVSRADLLHLLEAVQSTKEELRLLEQDADWFVSDVLDILESSEQLILERLEEKD